MVDLSKYTSLIDIMMHFDTPEKCKDAFAQSRWADGDVICPLMRSPPLPNEKRHRYIYFHHIRREYPHVS